MAINDITERIRKNYSPEVQNRLLHLLDIGPAAAAAAARELVAAEATKDSLTPEEEERKRGIRSIVERVVDIEGRVSALSKSLESIAGFIKRSFAITSTIGIYQRENIKSISQKEVEVEKPTRKVSVEDQVSAFGLILPLAIASIAKLASWVKTSIDSFNRPAQGGQPAEDGMQGIVRAGREAVADFFGFGESSTENNAIPSVETPQSTTSPDLPKRPSSVYQPRPEQPTARRPSPQPQKPREKAPGPEVSRTEAEAPGSMGSAGGEAGKATILDFIAQHESKSFGYNALVYGKNTPKSAPLTDMTLQEVFQYQSDMIKKGHASTAVGRYQFLKGTLKGLVDQAGLPLTTKFTPEIQDMLGGMLVDQAGYKRYIAGKISLERFQAGLANIWASLPKADGSSAYTGLAGNKVGTDSASLQAVLLRVKEPNTAVASNTPTVSPPPQRPPQQTAQASPPTSSSKSTGSASSARTIERHFGVSTYDAPQAST